MNDNEFETKKNILIETQHTHCTPCTGIVWYVFYIVETQRHWIKRFLYYRRGFQKQKFTFMCKTLTHLILILKLIPPKNSSMFG